MKKVLSTKVTPVLYQNRYCVQESFDLVISAQHRNNEKSVQGNLSGTMYLMFRTVSTLVISSNYYNKVLTSSSSIQIITNNEAKNIFTSRTSQISSGVINNTVELTEFRNYYCVCSFMKYRYIFGGNLDYKLNTCFKYFCETNTWIYIASMTKERYFAASTVFEGKIIVSLVTAVFYTKTVTSTICSQ